MGILKINETPVRTSRNFNINDISLDINIPNNFEYFSNNYIYIVIIIKKF